MKSRRNKNAGKHPSYDKRGMSKSSIEKKKAYDRAFSSSEEQKKKRAETNKKRREAQKAGKNIRGKDASHTSSGIRFTSTKSNRGSKTNQPGDRRARGGKS